MTNEEKAGLYDLYVREAERLERQNSKLKSEFPINRPENVESMINKINQRISELQKKLNDLYK